MALLELDAVHKTYVSGSRLLGTRQAVRAVDGVSLSLAAGECLGLVGESGCGKSTLGRLVLSLEPPDKGRIIFNGTSRHVVFQDYYTSLNPSMKVNRIISEPLTLNTGWTWEKILARVMELLDIVGMTAADGQKYPHQFSGGQLQRINIARAIALNPSLVVLDEAISSLDMATRAQILNLLLDIKTELKVAYLFISHDLEAVSYMADSLAVMYLGQIVEYLSSHEIDTCAKHPYTQTLLDPGINGTKYKEPEIITDLGCNYKDRCKLVHQTCFKHTPSLRVINGKQKVACHLYEKSGFH